MQKLNLNSNQTLTTKEPTQSSTNLESQGQSDSVSSQTGRQSNLSKGKKTKINYLWLLLVIGSSIGLGMATGFGTAKLYAKKSIPQTEVVVQPGETNQIKAGDVFGSDDETFKDTAEGYLESGGLDGEGSHRLLRPGGPSQTVYLTSSVMDLDKFVGMQVKVYGETYKGQKAGWLMDVGKVRVINPKGEKPPETEKL